MLYHDPAISPALPHSIGLQKGLFGIVHVFADRDMRGSNDTVIAHELLHTLGATDKYDLRTNQPLHPDGFAEPDREPLYPQSFAELMGGRIPVSNTEATHTGVAAAGDRRREDGGRDRLEEAMSARPKVAAASSLACTQLTSKSLGARWSASLDLAIARGAVTRVLGCNGAGKTLTLHTLAGLRAPAAVPSRSMARRSRTGRDVRWRASSACSRRRPRIRFPRRCSTPC